MNELFRFYLDSSPQSWHGYVVLNTGTALGQVQFVTLDQNDRPLTRTEPIELAAGQTLAVRTLDLFGSDLLKPEVASVRVVTTQPITGYQISGDESGQDVAALPDRFESSNDRTYAKRQKA